MQTSCNQPQGGMTTRIPKHDCCHAAPETTHLLLLHRRMKTTAKRDLKSAVVCYHCGAECSEVIKHEEHTFCCEGCRLVYDLLRENNLCTYYSLSEQPGHPADETQRKQFEILDRPEVSEKFLRFKSDERSRLVFRVNGMHCASCIWLLEHLAKIDKGIIRSEVNFPAREITIDFHPAKTSPARIATLAHNASTQPH